MPSRWDPEKARLARLLQAYEHATAAAVMPPIKTPDGRYIVVKDRLWRTTNPFLGKGRRLTLTKELMAARRAVGKALKAKDERLLKQARTAVDSAKVRLGERGRVWWSDGAPDYNRYLAKNTPYAAWYARRTRAQSPSSTTEARNV